MQIPETEIIVTKDGVELARRVVTPGEYLFGRGEDVDFHIDTPLASRHHARLYVNYDEWLIEDLASANGTFINDHPVAPNAATRVFPTQMLRVGDATVTLHRLRGSEAPDVSLAPSVAAGRTLLPEEVRARRYAIGKIVAQGGMGAILSAQDQAIRRGVAMKVMLQSSDAGDLTRFVEEAQITGQLEHPNIVPIYELSVDEQDQFFYTMKFVRGITLKKVLDLIASAEATAKKYPLGALLTIFQKVCDAIAFAHSKGVIHRDLKPENIMLGDFGEVLVMDWGLAKVLRSASGVGTAGPQVVSARRTVGSGSMTMAGAIMGTPQYMAPEQARGEVETMDQCADIYALGAILYHLLALRPSVTGGDAWAIVEKVARGEIEPLTSPPSKSRAIPDSLAAVCRKAMALDPAARYRSVGELQSDIAAYQNGFATSAENAGSWKQFTLLIKRNKAASLGVAAVLLVGGVLGTKAIIEGRRAEREAAAAKAALAELRATAPTFFIQSKLLTDQEKFDEALEKIGIALKLNPGDAGFHAQRGNILQSMERFAEAADAYAAVAKLNPQEPHAAENAAFSRTLAAAREKDGALTVKLRTEWRDALVQQGRRAEAIFAGRGLATDAEKMLPAWQAKVDAWLGKNAPRVKIDHESGRYYLAVPNLSLTDLSPLRGMPLQNLDISGNPHLKDLSPLADCTLDILYAFGDTDLVDLSPLKGKRLGTLYVNGTGVRDLSPLAGMPLYSLNLSSTAVSDLTPLGGARLKYLFLQNSQVTSLQPLRGQPLTTLFIDGTHITSLDPVGDAPLLDLQIGILGHLDLAALRQRQLRKLFAHDTTLEHLEVLAGMKELEEISLPPNLTDPALLRKLPHLRKVKFETQNQSAMQFMDAADFFRQYDGPEVQKVRAALATAGLKNMPLKNVNVDPAGRLHVYLQHTSIADLTPLRGLPINELDLYDTFVSDLEPLRGMPLETIFVSSTKVSSLEPLRGAPLKRINLTASKVNDVGILADFPDLEEIELPTPAGKLERLRTLKRLHYLSYKWNSDANHPAQTAEEFWKEYDAKHAAGKK